MGRVWEGISDFLILKLRSKLRLGTLSGGRYDVGFTVDWFLQERMVFLCYTISFSQSKAFELD